MTPAKGQPSPRKGQEYPPEVLTSEEVRRLLDTMNTGPTGIRNRALVTLLYRSGLRISEVLALKPSDVDLAAHSIRLLDTKSGRAQTRGFHPSADDALMRWIDTRRDLGINGHHTLFCSLYTRAGYPPKPKYGKLSDRYVRDMLKRAAENAGITKRVHPHGLRHTFAAELEAAGLSVTTISKLLGHGSMSVTAGYLDHLTNHQAVARLTEIPLPSIGEEEAHEAAVRAETDPDLLAIKEILGDPESRKILADVLKTAAARKKRTKDN